MRPGQSCYWARLKSPSGEIGAIIANQIEEGRFWLFVDESEYLEVGCRITEIFNVDPPEIVTAFGPGVYLVRGINVTFADGSRAVYQDITPGTYRADVGASQCYWERLKMLGGEIEAIIANGIGTGRFYVAVSGSDSALRTACKMELVPD